MAANPMSQPGQGTELTPARSDGPSGRLRLAAPGRFLTGLACLALAAALIAVVALAPSSVRPADNQWLRWMLDVRVPPGVFVAKVLNVVAGGTVMWIVWLAIAALAIRRRWRALAVFALAELCAELCIGPVKALVDRLRPAGPLVAVTGQSMPSGHALTAAVTAVALALIFTRPGRSRLLALAAAAAWSIFVALSRTYLSAHWLTDVVAGLLLGTGWAALWFGVLAPRQHTPRPPATLSLARLRRTCLRRRGPADGQGYLVAGPPRLLGSAGLDESGPRHGRGPIQDRAPATRPVPNATCSPSAPIT